MRHVLSGLILMSAIGLAVVPTPSWAGDTSSPADKNLAAQGKEVAKDDLKTSEKHGYPSEVWASDPRPAEPKAVAKPPAPKPKPREIWASDPRTPSKGE